MTRDEFVPAGEMELGEQVVALEGQLWRLTSITSRAGPKSVYNLEVAGEHVYYVGSDGLLVHNKYILKNVTKTNGKSYKAILTTTRKVPTELIKKAKRLGLRIHGHHIVMKGSFSNWLPDARKYVTDAQNILHRARINIHDVRNMAHSLNAAHSKAYAKAVAERLAKAAAKKGDLTVNVSKELFRMQQILEKGGKFWQ